MNVKNNFIYIFRIYKMESGKAEVLEIDDDLQTVNDFFQIIHELREDIEKDKYVIKKTPGPTISKVVPIWCSKISNPKREQVELFYMYRLDAFDDLMNITNVDGRYQLDLDFINYYADHFYIDNNCLCKDLLNKAVRIGGGKAGIVYAIGKDPKEKQIDYIIKQIPNVGLNLYLSLDIDELTPNLSMRNDAFYVNSLLMKKNVYSSMFYYTKDSEIKRYCLQIPNDNFTNQTLLHMILNQYLGDNPNYLYQFDAFYCLTGNRMDGYNITEFANGGDLSNFINKTILNEDDIINMIKQIMTPLFVLKHPKIGFLHSDLKPKNIFVNEINGVPYFKLADFDKSSIFYRNIRFYNNHFNYTIKSYGDLLNKTPFPLHKSSEGYIYYSMQDTTFYGKYIGFHEYIMSNPEGFYSSFDIYTFFYSLILERKIYEWMMANPKSPIWQIYNYLFHRNEKSQWDKFIKNISDIYEKKITGDITSIKFYWEQFRTNGFQLRYNIDDIYTILDINMKTIKNLFPKKTLKLIKIYKPTEDVFTISNDHHLCSIEPKEKDTTCRTNIYSKKSKDPRDLLSSYLYGYDTL
jgi:serine/threonine protein kinase